MSALQAYLPQMAKALLAAGVAGVGAMATAYADGVATTGEKWSAAGAALVALAAVWRIPNADAPQEG